MELNAKTTRKKWLKSWNVLFGYNVAILILSLIVGGLNREARDDAILVGIPSIGTMLWLYFCRKCSYEKPGTKLLSFVLFMSIGGIVKGANELFKNFDFLSLIFFGVEVGLIAWFFNTSLELRRLNKTLKDKPIKKKALAS